MATDITRLTASPGQMLTHPHTGANYYDGESIITHLNYALGPGGWDWLPLEHGLDVEADQVWVLGQLTARIVVDAPDGDGYVTLTTVKVERGWHKIGRVKATGKYVDLGANYKAAATDGLKRAARLLGVGLDAWADDAPDARPAQTPAARPAPARAAITTSDAVRAAAMVTGAAPQNAPKAMRTRDDLVGAVASGVEAARAIGLVVADVDTNGMSRSSLVATIRGLADAVRDAQAARPAAAS